MVDDGDDDGKNVDSLADDECHGEAKLAEHPGLSRSEAAENLAHRDREAAQSPRLSFDCVFGRLKKRYHGTPSGSDGEGRHHALGAAAVTASRRG
jgi:hypothetical protein